MNTETWKWLPDQEGDYEVSSHGHVRSWIGWKGRPATKPRMLAQSTNSAGYLTVVLRDRRSAQLVHHLVARTFHGPRPDGLFVCHIDGDKANNRPRNLIYDTPSRNQQDRARHGTQSNRPRTHCRRRGHELTPDNVFTRSGHRVCRRCTQETAHAA